MGSVIRSSIGHARVVRQLNSFALEFRSAVKHKRDFWRHFGQWRTQLENRGGWRWYLFFLMFYVLLAPVWITAYLAAGLGAAIIGPALAGVVALAWIGLGWWAGVAAFVLIFIGGGWLLGRKGWVD